ncbi:MAG: DUF2807 domain-containing protein [Pedobacter sp.]|nr:MAG: DUF2807 domain-containing protein [Pedobacter sp.]
MSILKLCLAFVLLCNVSASFAQKKTVDHFEKIIVSPYIKVTFVQGDEESVVLEDLKVDDSKLHIEVSDKTLHIYLDGARFIPKNEKEYTDEGTQTRPLYDKTSVTATITYRALRDLSIRGEEEQLCKSPIAGDKFILHVYGESKVVMNKVNLQQLHTTLYGESTLEIKSGSIREQAYTCYGEGVIDALAVTGRSARLKAYGEAEFKLNLSDRMKVTAFGEAKVYYKGSPEISKGLHFGELALVRID